MAIAGASIRHTFGLRSDVAASIGYQDEQTLVYPCGSNIVLYNVDQKAQRFINGLERSQGMTSMAISPNRRFVALAERSEKAVAVVYDLQSLKKKKALTCAESVSVEFVSVAFSPDSKYLAAQSGAPDWTLVFWCWEKNKQLAIVKTINPPNPHLTVSQISFNPQDSTQLCVVGNGVFKLYRYSENNLKQFAVSKTEPQNFLCHAWMPDERVIVGTDNGRWLLLENGEQKAECNILSLAKRDEEEARTEANEAAKNAGLVTAIVASSKGFAVACGPGAVHWFERSDDRDLYRRLREIHIPHDANSVDPSRAEGQMILHLTVSPSDETLTAITDSKQIYSISLATADIGKVGDYSQFEILAQSFHSGHVSGLDVCLRKPLVATCSVDRSVRIWNFESNSLELYKEFAEEAYSIALHPSGLYLLVGFSDKLRLMNILIDDIRTFREITIRGCRECAFSNGGHLFAAVHGNVIQLYSCTTFDNVNNLKGHNGKIRALVWAVDDSKLISCGMDGAVYEWDPYTGRRLGESVLKSCSYTGVTVSPDAKATFAVGSDKSLKEICDSQVLRECNFGETTLTGVAMSYSGRMLFAGTELGTIRAIKFPLSSPPEWQEHLGHSAPITKMKVTCNDEFLITVSEDSTILIWRIQDKEGRGLKRDKEIGWAEEILITKSDLEEKNSMTQELKTRVDELKMENEYQLRLKDMNYNEKIKELTEKFIQEMESLKTKNQVMKTEKEKEEAKHEEQLQEVMEKHSKEMQDLESANNQKLMLEYEKYQELQAKSQKMQEDYERQLQDMEDARQRALEELTVYFEKKLSDSTQSHDQLNDQMRHQTKEYEETKRLIEEDADREILDTKIKFERRLREEKEANTRLKGETGIMRKKFSSLQKEIDDHKDEIRRLQGETQKLNNVIRNLEKDMQGLKKEIQERDETIQDKEKRIYDLKKKNQELEKFKFVLDYKIKELKKQIEPRENDIKNYKEQIQEMESELERFHKQNTQLELSITEMKQKQKATDKELKNERLATRDVEAMTKRFKTDLHHCVGYIQDSKMLKESVVALYKKHVQDDMTSDASADADIQREFNRQREHLERTVASQRKKLAKDTEIHRADYVRIMQENVTLIKEINDLRRELKSSRMHIHDLEAALGLHRKTSDTAQSAVLNAVKANRPAPMLERDAEEMSRIVETQRVAMQQLRDRIAELENRPLSSTARQLPPLEVPGGVQVS